MGPTEEALALADHLLAQFPAMGTDRYTLGYVIDAWAEEIDRRDP